MNDQLTSKSKVHISDQIPRVLRCTAESTDEAAWRPDPFHEQAHPQGYSKQRIDFIVMDGAYWLEPLPVIAAIHSVHP